MQNVTNTYKTYYIFKTSFCLNMHYQLGLLKVMHIAYFSEKI